MTWAHTGFTLGTEIKDVSQSHSISGDLRTLTMRASWTVRAGIPTPWGEYYFHSERVSNSCHETP